MKQYKKLTILFLILCMTCNLTGCNMSDVISGKTKVVLTTGQDKGAIFQIGDNTCYYNEFMVYLTNTQNRYESVYGNNIWSITSGESDMGQKIKDSVAFKIAQIKTLSLLADRYGIRLDNEDEGRVQQASDAYYASLNQTEIDVLNVTKEGIKQMYEEYALAHKVYAYIIQDINPEISDDEARTVSVDWIHLKALDGDYKVQNNAQNILMRIRNGEDYEVLANTFSDDTLVSHAISRSYNDPAVRAVAFDLAEGEVSSVVTGIDGFYIIRCLSTLDRAETDENKKKIVEERKNEAFSEVYETFAQEQIKSINEKAWDSITLLHDENVKTSSFFDVYDSLFTN